MMRLCMACVATCTMLALVPLPAAAQRAQVVSRGELDAGGWTRLSEIVFAMRGVARSSVDGITVAGDVSGLPTWSLPPGEHWTVLVDGAPMPIGFGGLQLLDLLPVSLAQLDSVTLQRVPTVAAGRIAMHGILHLYTQRGIGSLRASVSHYSGNEAGDPGPFAFTAEASPNVDNSGPFHQGRVAYGRPDWDTDLAVRRWTDNLTDQRMRARYEEAAAPAAPDLWVQQLASTFRAGVTGAGGRHDLHAGVAQIRGTTFLPAAHQDQSLRTRLAYGGIGGSIGTPASWRAGYRVSASRLEAAPYGGPLPATFAHVREAFAAAADVRRTIAAVDATLGVAISRTALQSAMAADAPTHGLVEGDVLLSLATAAAWEPHLAVSVGRGTESFRAGGVLSATRPLDARTALTLRAAASTRALGDDGTWVDLALSGLSEIAGTRRTSVSAGAEWSRLVVGGATLAYNGRLRHEFGLRVVSPDAPASLLPVRERTSGPASLLSAELGGTLDLPFGGIALGGVAYRFATPLRASEGAWKAANTLPRHLLDASLAAAPVLDIRLRTAVHLASPTRWPTGAAGEDTRAPAVTRVDVSAEKWFVGRRLRVQALARNLLNDGERYHPLGADFRLRVFAGATATF